MMNACGAQGLQHLLESPEIGELLTQGAQRQVDGVATSAPGVGKLRSIAAAAAGNTGDVVRLACMAAECRPGRAMAVLGQF